MASSKSRKRALDCSVFKIRKLRARGSMAWKSRTGRPKIAKDLVKGVVAI
jgi:hypothetical protein